MSIYCIRGKWINIQDSDISRFWKKVNKKSTDDCWEWINCKGRYGRFWLGNSTFDAHRISWLINNGQIPSGMEVLHTCDNKICVNPDHLYLGTQSDNNLDRIQRFQGKVAGRPKRFSEDDIDKIKYLCKHKTQKEVAEIYNTTASTINLIVNDKLYINGSSHNTWENKNARRI
jgi:hypothetical protein